MQQRATPAGAAHRDELNWRPSAFFSVSGSASDPGPKGQADARRCLDEFLTSTGWCPILVATIGGAIAYTKYNLLLRWIMKWISYRAGASVDTSRDHEYTDWARVEHFAHEFDAWLAGMDRPRRATGQAISHG